MARDESPELIEKEMEQTRASLTGKVAALENQVVGTLHNATETVSTTVDSVKAAVQDITATVKDTLTESASTVKNTLTESVTDVSDSIKSTFDLSHHTRTNPWGMVGGAAAVGFVAGLLLGGRSKSRSYTKLGYQSPQPGQSHGLSSASYGATSGSPSYGGSSGSSYGGGSSSGGGGQSTFQAAVSALPSRPSWLDGLMEKAGQELRKVGELAIAQASQALKQTAEQQIPKLLNADTLMSVGQRFVGDHGSASHGSAGHGGSTGPAAGYAGGGSAGPAGTVGHPGATPASGSMGGTYPRTGNGAGGM